MLIDEAIKKIHRKFAKDTDYPEAGSEDLLVYLDHVDDAITTWENLVHEGYCWNELKTSATLAFGGTGTDSLPENFLAFITAISAQDDPQLPIIVLSDGTTYTKTDSNTGIQAKQNGLTPYIFWTEGANICTLPVITGSVDVPYLRKATRFTEGDETDPIDMQDPTFVVDFGVGKVFLDNEDDTLAQVYIQQAQEKLQQMKYKVIA